MNSFMVKSNRLLETRFRFSLLGFLWCGWLSFQSSYTNRLVDCGVNADPFQLETSLLPRLTPIKPLAKQRRLRLPSSFPGCFQPTTAAKTRDLKLSPSKGPTQQHGYAAPHL